MDKFDKVYKRKKEKVEELNETKILKDFKSVYNKLLENYNVSDFYQLSEKYQNIFLSDLNKFWTEEKGLTESGNKFLKKSSNFITENSSTLQKRNYLKKRSKAVINETLKNSGIKYKLYDVIDEMYHSISATKLSEVLTPDVISNVIQESFKNSLTEFTKEVYNELYEGEKEARKKSKKSTRAKTLDEQVGEIQKKYQKELNEGKIKQKLQEITDSIKEDDDYSKDLSMQGIDKIAKKNLSKKDYEFYKENKESIKDFL